MVRRDGVDVVSGHRRVGGDAGGCRALGQRVGTAAVVARPTDRHHLIERLDPLGDLLGIDAETTGAGDRCQVVLSRVDRSLSRGITSHIPRGARAGNLPRLQSAGFAAGSCEWKGRARRLRGLP